MKKILIPVIFASFVTSLSGFATPSGLSATCPSPGSLYYKCEQQYTTVSCTWESSEGPWEGTLDLGKTNLTASHFEGAKWFKVHGTTEGIVQDTIGEVDCYYQVQVDGSTVPDILTVENTNFAHETSPNAAGWVTKSHEYAPQPAKVCQSTSRQDCAFKYAY